MHEQDKAEPIALPKDPFSYIGFWQFMTFIILLLLIWLNEIKDVSGILADTPQVAPNYFRGCLLTAAVLMTAIITIGNTYIQQHRVLNSLISVCSNCHRVRVNKENWLKMEDYINDTSLLSFTHGLCPECKTDLMQKIQDRIEAKSEDPNLTRIE